MITSETARNQYAGNAATTLFAYGWPVTSKTELKATRTSAAGVDTLLVVDVDYTVNGVGNSSSATWTVLYPISGTPLPADGSLLTIVPHFLLEQLTDYNNQGALFSKTVEASLDHLTLVDQQIQEQVTRAIKLPVGTTLSSDTILSSITTSQAAAAASASAASTSATAAATSATAAATSATGAASSATSAAASAATASAIGSGVLTTKGDLPSFSTVIARLPVGANNTLLVADSAAATGNKWASIDLASSMVTGITPILNGGTGQSVRAAAFNGLAPASSVQGDIMYHDGTNWVRLPKGTTLQQLRMNAGATIPEWFTNTSGIFTAKYTSAQQTITAGGPLTLPHSLGASPFGVSTILHCTTAEGGYSIGDELICNPGNQDQAGVSGLSIVIDATNLNVRFSTTTIIHIFNKGSGAAFNGTSANWTIIFKAWL